MKNWCKYVGVSVLVLMPILVHAALPAGVPDYSKILNNVMILQVDSFDQEFHSSLQTSKQDAAVAGINNMRKVHLGGLNGYQYQYDDRFDGETLVIDLGDASGHLYAHYSIAGHMYFRAFIQRVRIDAKKKFSYGKACDYSVDASGAKATCPWF